MSRALLSTRPLASLDDHDRHDAIHAAHQELGRLALAAGRLAAAAKHLLQSAEVGDSPVLGSFGPCWGLAEALLDRGRRGDVVRYIDRVRAFWTSHAPLLDAWKQIIADGATPDFGVKWTPERREGPAQPGSLER